MGLDMYFMAVQPKEIAYWRKHNALHHWFEEEAKRLGLIEDAADFNLVHVPLTTELLDRLETDIRNGALVPTEGFFFGGTNYDPKEDMEEDLKAIATAREHLAKNQEVYYTSWW